MPAAAAAVAAAGLHSDYYLSWLEPYADLRAKIDGVRENSAKLGRTPKFASIRRWVSPADGTITNNWPGFTLRYRQRTRRLALADYLDTQEPAGHGFERV